MSLSSSRAPERSLFSAHAVLRCLTPFPGIAPRDASAAGETDKDSITSERVPDLPSWSPASHSSWQFSCSSKMLHDLGTPSLSCALPSRLTRSEQTTRVRPRQAAAPRGSPPAC
eukprot:768028-Hanusia_phi.AAC.4